jgi:hypothetical protein
VARRFEGPNALEFRGRLEVGGLARTAGFRARCCCKSSSRAGNRLRKRGSISAPIRAPPRQMGSRSVPIGECCQPIGPKAREGKMTNRGARASGHANGHDPHDCVHQVLERLDLESAVCRDLRMCFVQFCTSVFQFSSVKVFLRSCSVSRLRSPKALQTSGHYVVLPAPFRATRRPTRFCPFPRQLALLRSRRQSMQNRHRSDSHQAKLFGWIEDWIRKNHADKIA